MPAASRSGPGPAGASEVLASERAYLRQAREYLRLMREDVLSLRALGGDPVSEEYLKADLYRRAEALHDLPDVAGIRQGNTLRRICCAHILTCESQARKGETNLAG